MPGGRTSGHGAPLQYHAQATTIGFYTEVGIAAVAAKGGSKGAGKDAGKTAAPAKGGGGYEVSRPLGKCTVTGEPIQPGQKFHAALKEVPTGIERADVCEAAWGEYPKEGLLASWLATMPTGEAKKKVFVDDEVLLTLFERLSETTEGTKLRFRFVLGLILMRKRLITYEGEKTGSAGDSVWLVKIKGKGDAIELLNPHLSEGQVEDVAGQLGEILNSEL